MFSTTDLHIQFAELFKDFSIRPFAYLLSRRLSEGNICLTQEDIYQDPEDLPDIYTDASLDWSLLSDNYYVCKPGEAKAPFLLDNDRLYIYRYYSYEQLIYNKLYSFAALSAAKWEERQALLNSSKDFLASFHSGTSSSLPQTDWQKVASIVSFLNNFTIITGGPGTGKTTTVARILALLYRVQPDIKVALAAPTGKAAARMLESLKRSAERLDEDIQVRFASLEPYTVHRLLGFIPNRANFRYNKANPLRFDVVIVDESSMLDVAMMAKLLDAIADNTRLIFLGDKNQLASVEAGSILGDLCNALPSLNSFSSEWVHFINTVIEDDLHKIAVTGSASADVSIPLRNQIVELIHSHRFNSEAGIGRLSKAIINNDPAIIALYSTTTDPSVEIDENYSSVKFDSFISGYAEYITEPDIKKALEKLSRLRVLCAVREGDQGLYQVNKDVEAYLARRRLIKMDSIFYVNRPVMVVANNYQVGLYNGDIGIVRPDQDGVIKVWFEGVDGVLKSVLPAYVPAVETAYAMTIHKSQGSEFESVCIVIPKSQEIAILTRELLYTAVTRARNYVFIQAELESLLAISSRKVSRASGIISRFLNK